MKNARTTVILALLVLATTLAVRAGQGAIDSAKALVGTSAFADHRTIKPGVIRKRISMRPWPTSIKSHRRSMAEPSPVAGRARVRFFDHRTTAHNVAVILSPRTAAS